jgi:hypothetical protein
MPSAGGRIPAAPGALLRASDGKGPGPCARLDGVISRLFAMSKLLSFFLASRAQWLRRDRV